MRILDLVAVQELKKKKVGREPQTILLFFTAEGIKVSLRYRHFFYAK